MNKFLVWVYIFYILYTRGKCVVAQSQMALAKDPKSREVFRENDMTFTSFSFQSSMF